jgi:hypothetical protein
MLLVVLATAIAAMSLSGCTQAHRAASDLEPVHGKLVVSGAQLPPGGASAMAMSRDGRLFVARAEAVGVGEVLPGGRWRAYPGPSWSDWNGRGGPGALRALISPTALWVDSQDQLWVLDTGRHVEQGLLTGGPKLVQIDLATDQVVDVTYFDKQRDLRSASRLTDVRADSAYGAAYVLDRGRGVVLVIDRARRSVRAVSVPGASALALTPDGAWLYVAQGEEGRLSRASTAALRDSDATEAEIAEALTARGAVGSRVSAMAIDGVLDLYAAAPQRRAILKRRAVGDVTVLLANPQIGEARALVIGAGRYLHFLADAPADQVLKVSLNWVQQAFEARQDLEAARQRVAEVSPELRKAEAAAKQKRAAAELAQREAAALSATAAEAQQAAHQAVAKKIEAVAAAVDAARWQAIVKGKAPATERNAGDLTERTRQRANALADLARRATERATAASALAQQAQARAKQLQTERAAAEAALAALQQTVQLARSEAERASKVLRSAAFAEMQSRVAEHLQAAVAEVPTTP